MLLKYTYLPWTLTLFITPIYSNYILLIVFRFILRDPNLILEEKNKEFESDLRQKVKAESVKSFLLFRPKRRFCCKLKFMRNFSTIRHLQILAESCRTNCAQFVVPTYQPSFGSQHVKIWLLCFANDTQMRNSYIFFFAISFLYWFTSSLLF